MINIQIQNKSYKVELANNPLQQTIGLMFRNSLKDTAGMLFWFNKEVRFSFWMLFTFIPLDIIWIDKNGFIVEITQKTTYWNKKDWIKTLFKVYKPKYKYQYALELLAGSVKKDDIKIGQKVQFS